MAELDFDYLKGDISELLRIQKESVRRILQNNNGDIVDKIWRGEKAEVDIINMADLFEN